MLPVLQPDGSDKLVDIRSLPFVRFDDNEAHCDGLYGFNLGEGVNRVGPDARHPFVIRRMKLWDNHYAFRPESPACWWRICKLRIRTMAFITRITTGTCIGT